MCDLLFALSKSDEPEDQNNSHNTKELRIN